MDNQLASDDADTQFVGRLLWEELHETQAPSRFEWNPADILQPSAGSLTPPSPPSAPPSTSTRSSSTSSPTPEVTPGFPVPSDLAQWRQRLFESTGETITMSLEQWEQYWPFVTNFWTRNRQPYAPKRKRTVRTHWICRFHKEKAYKSLGTGKRDKQVREEIGCPAKLVEVHDCPTNRREFTMTGRHNHSITELDMTKRNDAIHSWVETQLLQGFSATAIEKVAKGKGKDPSARQNLLDAGGRYLSVRDIKNVAQRLNIRSTQPRHVAGKVSAREQAREAIEWLQTNQEEWHSAFLETTYKGSPSPGLLFARKTTLKILRERGVLTMMDSTHNTNKEEWCVHFQAAPDFCWKPNFYL